MEEAPKHGVCPHLSVHAALPFAVYGCGSAHRVSASAVLFFGGFLDANIYLWRPQSNRMAVVGRYPAGVTCLAHFVCPVRDEAAELTAGAVHAVLAAWARPARFLSDLSRVVWRFARAMLAFYSFGGYNAHTPGSDHHLWIEVNPNSLEAPRSQRGTPPPADIAFTRVADLLPAGEKDSRLPLMGFNSRALYFAASRTVILTGGSMAAPSMVRSVVCLTRPPLFPNSPTPPPPAVVEKPASPVPRKSLFSLSNLFKTASLPSSLFGVSKTVESDELERKVSSLVEKETRLEFEFEEKVERRESWKRRRVCGV